MWVIPAKIPGRNGLSGVDENSCKNCVGLAQATLAGGKFIVKVEGSVEILTPLFATGFP